ncbi:hypothetical protein R1sor_025292 [Riccia sorocarpa]|uniref:Auxin-responsive protein n=1 Tax=Riccia sorocarpa TaxID=122646 RepID=A0ABD3GA76_9MARC
MHCAFSSQCNMDSSYAGHSFRIDRKPFRFPEAAREPQASSCLSSTMVDSNDRDDSGSSQPPSTSEAQHRRHIHDPSLQRPELELSISSLNDAQTNLSTGQPRLRPVKEEAVPSSASTGKDESADGETESSFTGPPRKRARMSPLGFTLEEREAGTEKKQQQTRHLSLSSGSDITGLHDLMPSRSLPVLARRDREASPSPSRGSVSGSKSGTAWWLTHKGSGDVVDPQHYQPAGSSFVTEGRRTNLGNSGQEREPPSFPVSRNVEFTHERRVEDAAAAVSRRPTEQQGRTQSQQQNPSEHLFFSGREVPTAKANSPSSGREESAQRSSLMFFPGSREGVSLQGSSPDFSRPGTLQHPFEPQGERRRQQPTVSESQQQRSFSGEGQQHPQGSSSRQQSLERRSLLQTLEQRSSQQVLQGGGRNVSASFYTGILDGSQQPGSGPFSQGALQNTFSRSGLSFGLPGQLSRGTGQVGGGPVPLSGEANRTSLVEQQVNNESMRNLLAGKPNMSSLTPFISGSHFQSPDPSRLSFPNISSLDFLQSLQRQSFPQPSERPSWFSGSQMAGSQQQQQDLQFRAASSASHHVLPAELNFSFPAHSPSQASAALREFFSPQSRLSGAQARGLATGSYGLNAPVDLPKNLSLQGTGPTAPLTVLMEGRPFSRRIVLQEYDSYGSFSAAMRSLFESEVPAQEPRTHGESCNLANAIPGYAIVYQDEEGDVLLAGDLPWRDFVRAARQIRIVPASKISFKPPTGTACVTSPEFVPKVDIDGILLVGGCRTFSVLKGNLWRTGPYCHSEEVLKTGELVLVHISLLSILAVNLPLSLVNKYQMRTLMHLLHGSACMRENTLAKKDGQCRYYCVGYEEIYLLEENWLLVASRCKGEGRERYDIGMVNTLEIEKIDAV